MKKMLYLSVILFSFLIFNLSNVISGEINFGSITPCKEWESQNWEGPRSMILEYNGCTYLIAYWVENYTERLQITEIYALYGNNCNANSPEIRKQAYVKLFKKYSHIFDDPWVQAANQEHSCHEYVVCNPGDPVNLIVPSGYLSPEQLNNLIYNSLPNGDIVFNNIINYVIPCQGTACCNAFYQCYYDEDWNLIKIIWYDLDPASQEDCPEPSRCTPGCNDLKFDWYAPGYEPQEFMSVYENDYDYYRTKIKPNPNKGYFNLSFSSEIKGSLNIYIFDSNGKIIFSERNSNISNVFEKEIKLNNISSGKYYYQIFNNGFLYSIGSFVVNK